MCKVDGIEVAHENLPAWDAAVAAFQRNLRSRLRVIRDAAAETHTSQSLGSAAACVIETRLASRR